MNLSSPRRASHSPLTRFFILVTVVLFQNLPSNGFSPFSVCDHHDQRHRLAIAGAASPATTTTSLAAATSSSRRDFARGTLACITSFLLPVSLPTIAPAAFAAENDVTAAAAAAAAAPGAPPVDMKLFVDPKGLFSIIVPSRFFKLRRTDKGDLPDEKTGKGRRGSSIFTAGDLGKAEIIAVER